MTQSPPLLNDPSDYVGHGKLDVAHGGQASSRGKQIDLIQNRS